ncbi:MAG: hypothetical protein IKG40_00910 [Bacilli bacterium]|nr:hypothetical protein [Bacilli bacterium]
MFILIMFLALSLVLVFYIVFYSFLLSCSYNDKENKYNYDPSSVKNFHYNKKNYINDFDSEFVDKLHPLVDEFDVEISPNVNLVDVVNKSEFGDISELNTLISFGIFTKDFKNVLLLINFSNNDVVRSICKKSKIGYMEINPNSLSDLKHIKSRVSKAISK